MRPRIPSPAERQARADRERDLITGDPDSSFAGEPEPEPVAPPYAQRAAVEEMGETRWRSVAIALAVILAAVLALSALKGRRDPFQSIDPATPRPKKVSLL